MRIRFQRIPWDIFLAVGYAVLVSGSLLASGFGNPLGALLVMIVPGYLAMTALLPRRSDADWVLRAALSLGFSFAIVAFVGLFLNFMPWGLTFTSADIAVLVATLVLGGLAYVRRMALPSEERLELTLDLGWVPWTEYSLLEKGLALALVAILALTIPFVGIALVQPRPTEPFTELDLLGPTGNFSGIPTHLNVSQTASVEVVVTNHESATVNYTVQVDLLGVRIVVNATTGANETLVLNRTAWSEFNFTLADRATWTLPYGFSIPAAGTWWVRFSLLRSSATAVPYRTVHLLIAVF